MEERELISRFRRRILGGWWPASLAAASTSGLMESSEERAPSAIYDAPARA